MTQRDRSVKWFVYALGVVPVWIFETMVLNRLPLFGVIPVLLPLAGVAVALWEGPIAGGIFGLCLGVVADAAYPGAPGGMTLGVTLLCVLTGLITRSGLKQNFMGFLLCSALSMVLLDGIRVLWGAVAGLGRLTALLPVACKEVLWSLCFTPLLYLLFKLIHHVVPKEYN